jgi:N-acetylglutamate synthase-like GNAT family acetyltransferase
MSAHNIVEATLFQREAVSALVRGAHLPDIGATFPTEYVVAQRGPVIGATVVGVAVVGVAGIEVYGTDALLRSVAVADAVRNRGLGRDLVRNRLEAARTRGLRAVYLLTTTAPGFFEGLGFERVPRASAPASVQASEEFASLCPDSAVCLKYPLMPPTRRH